MPPMDFMEHGAMTMPAVRKEPLAMLAPMLLMSCTTSASPSTSFTECGVSTCTVILAALLMTRWVSRSGIRARTWRMRIP